MLLARTIDDLVLLLPDALHVFLAVWLFAVGGCVGSFLNVVVLRIPAGIGIARSGSRCPVCLHAIRWHDNIPLISWLVLRGRCRDCGTWISVRYPLVELLVATIFLLLGLSEGLSVGGNLPLLPEASRFYHLAPFATWSIYACHILLLMTLVTAALMTRDGNVVPRPVFAPALLIGMIASLFLPELHPVRFGPEVAANPWLANFSVAAVGLLAGAVIGLFTWPATGVPNAPPRGWQTALLACAVVGLYLGVQAVAAVVAAVAVAFLTVSLLVRILPEFEPRRLSAGPWLGYLLLASILYIINWRRLVDGFPALGSPGSIATIAGPLAIVFTASMVTRWITRFRPSTAFVRTPQGDAMSLASPTPVDPEANLKAILDSPSYLPVEYDAQFLQRSELRAVRVQLELLKPELGFFMEGVKSTIVVFGGTQILESSKAREKLAAARVACKQVPDDPQRRRAVQRFERIVAKATYYDAAREFGKLVSSKCQIDGQCDYVVVTGGGPGIMEAANRGAYDVGAKSIGLNVTLPEEQSPNAYITPNLCFQFHYFAMRKMHFLMRAKALVVFPGGFGTLDELFDALTLRQTRRMQEIPIILFGRPYWDRAIDFQFLADEGVIADEHLELFSYADTAEEAWQIITAFHKQTSSRPETSP